MFFWSFGFRLFYQYSCIEIQVFVRDIPSLTFFSITLIAQVSELELDKDSLQCQWERFSVNLGGLLASMKSNSAINMFKKLDKTM